MSRRKSTDVEVSEAEPVQSVPALEAPVCYQVEADCSFMWQGRVKDFVTGARYLESTFGIQTLNQWRALGLRLRSLTAEEYHA